MALATQETYVAVTTRPGVELPVWLMDPGHASHIVILFSGGEGRLEITSAGIGRRGNFLVRSRNRFAAQGMLVAVADKPSDRAGLHEFRTSTKHAQDIRLLMAYLRQHYPGKPLWLVGTSRGTISVANAASRLQDKEGPDGIVLTASVTRGGSKNRNSLRDVNLAAIRVPTLVLHNKLDECAVTPYAEAQALLGQLNAARDKAFEAVSGGSSKGNPCKAKSYHGFRGIEAEAVERIAAWINLH